MTARNHIIGAVPIDFAAVREAIGEAGGQATALLRSLDPADCGKTIRRSHWTVRDTAVHLAADVQMNADAAVGLPFDVDLPAGARTNERMATLNGRVVSEASESDSGTLADGVERAVSAILSTTEGRSGSDRVATPWYGDGVSLDLDAAACVMLGELVVHGYDIGQAVGRRWPVDPRHAALVLAGVASMLPLYVSPTAAAGVMARYAINVRRGGGFVVSIDDGVATVEPSGSAADCRISADPVALLLVAYGRKGQWGQILQGKVLASGRKPWRALAFRALFTDP